jgi:NIPSNAP
MAAGQLFELRTYHTAPGKLDALKARFANHSVRLFAKYGVTVVGFWVARNANGQPSDDFVYLLAFPSSEAREQSWEAFRSDPDWLAARADSEVDGPLILSAEAVLLDPTEHSLMS